MFIIIYFQIKIHLTKKNRRFCNGGKLKTAPSKIFTLNTLTESTSSLTKVDFSF